MSRSRPSARVQAAVAIVVVLVILVRGLLVGADDPSGASAPRSGGSSSSGARDAASADVPTGPVRVRLGIDGDTIQIDDHGRGRRVRLLGIDSPESSTLRTGHVECGGEQAADFIRRLIERWPEVKLVTDPSQDAVDQYGRILAYVRPAGVRGTTFQQLILTAGWARVYVYDRTPFSQVGAFRAAAATAKANRVGVWASCGGDFRRPTN